MLMVAGGIARGPDAPKNVVLRQKVFMPGGCDRRFLQQSEAQILADDCCWTSSRETNAKGCVGPGPSGKLDGRSTVVTNHTIGTAGRSRTVHGVPRR
jgi:hypothetical protein